MLQLQIWTVCQGQPLLEKVLEIVHLRLPYMALFYIVATLNKWQIANFSCRSNFYSRSVPYFAGEKDPFSICYAP